MRDIFRASGEVAPISPISRAGVLPPIIHSPPPLVPSTPKLVLCYFLVKTNAEALDAILAANPMPGVEFHCFTSTPLTAPRSQLHSHQKQRKLFQELFAKCTAVIVSAGNETVWEAVCRGVPVLAIPTEGHGEQLLNAAVHARNFPLLVRQRPRLAVDDVQWLVKYDLEVRALAWRTPRRAPRASRAQGRACSFAPIRACPVVARRPPHHACRCAAQDPPAVAESAHLRKLVDDFNEAGSPLLGVSGASTEVSTYRAEIKRRVSAVLDSAKSFVTRGDAKPGNGKSS